ncbi:hypothetical protein DSM106972_087530 [Dulcicalothrix desertica PCC 7102]|uniref:Carrier domain-containing protein n=1 Tax=Dulcicalothrix desertica PCC 7102 TaxID=232991 RepID=A0A433URW9_9CYAN|nr:non-ribosomal peptide synthetase [Dulcicalothrix desertica]RUS96566.1 hypothetical protein DSM106972_087530 [Dulcicalothrix desertica PCC 7102]TWH51406.1 non-ribosomal peptide synthase protein (TIGR01720 family)/amino acid adenylation domain-containing protein [Dulcicalothrix desertica PCC 7102]
MNLKDNIENIYPLTPLQKGLLFHSLYNPESAVYFEQLSCTLEGAVSIEAVNQAWQSLIDRHSILRTAIITKGQTEPVQVVFRKIVFKVVEQDWRGLNTFAQQNRLQQFLIEDRSQGFVLNRPPLMRVTLIRLGEESWQMVWSHHHLLLDGWSMQLLMREFFLLHKAAKEGVKASLPSVRPFGDFLSWLKQKNSQAAEPFWRHYLQGFSSQTPLSIIPAKKRDNISNNTEIRLQLNPEETAQLQKLARACNVTLNTIIQGAWAILLNRYSRSEDIVYGITVAGRPPEMSGVEQMIGPFINTLPLRVSVSNQTLDSWLQMLQQQQVEMREFEHSSLVDIQRLCDVPRGQTLFETLLAFENFPVDKSLKAENFGLNIQDVSFFEVTNYPITLIVIPGLELLFKLTYDSQRFDEDAMQLLLEQLHNLLKNMARDAKTALSSLSLLTSNLTSPPTLIQTQGDTLGACFGRTVSKYPERIAITFGQENITYGELDRRSNSIARFLQKQGIGREKRVAICLERSIDLIIAMLGVVKAGGIYVPVDPNYPRERIEFTVTDCEAELILTTQCLSEVLPASAQLLYIDALDAPHLVESDAPVLNDNLNPEDGAYVIYTSGSTGKPKGVLVTQNNVTRLFSNTNEWFGFNENDVWTFFHSFAFDFSVWEIWGALLYGGRLVIVSYAESRNPQKFLQLLQEQKVTVLNQTPSAFTQLLAAESTSSLLTQLRYIIFGGEALNLQSLRPWFDRHGEETQLVNMYGITETTVHVTYRPIRRQDLLDNVSASLVGVPIPDLDIYLLDPNGNLLPPGVTGEIYVGGAGVSRGYLNRPEINKERFIPNSFASDSNARLYRSGDLARFLGNGDLEYLGRIDNQVKIRGFRIEIGEIEAALSQFPQVVENIVVVHSEDGNQRLVAYLVCTGAIKSIEALRNHLLQSLPDYMVPSQFIYLDKLPLTTNGKVDHKALPAPEFKRENLEVSYVPPETDAEKTLAQIWAQVLGVNTVGRYDNYFALGGDSIRSIRVCSLALSAGLTIKLEQIFSYPILSELAALSESKQSSASDTYQAFELITPTDREKLQQLNMDAVDAYPLAQLQAGMLFHSDYFEGATAYNDVFSFRIRMPFNLNIWQQAYAEMLQHNILKTAFYLGEFSQPIQVVLKEANAEIKFVDFTSLSCSQHEAEINLFIQKQREEGFDWSKAPLVRFYIHHLDQDIIQVTFALHHAIMDGWSLAQFLSELINTYLHLLDSKVPLPQVPPSLQYSRFVALEQEALKDKTQKSFWQQQLASIPFTQLPRYQVDNSSSGQMAKIDIALSHELSQQIKALSNQLGVSVKTVLLAVHMRLLAFYSGEEEVVTGLVCNGRPEEKDGERVLGLFLNTVPFRLQLSGGSWIDLIKQTFRNEQLIIPNRRFPLAEIQRMHGNQPLYESSFNFVHFHVYKGLLELRDIELIESLSFDETNIPFSVSWSEEVDSGNLLFNISYNNSEFDEQQAKRMGNYCARMCESLVSDPEANYTQVTEEFPVYPTTQTESTVKNITFHIHEIFEKRAVDFPDLPAVTCLGKTWTYSELNQKANQLARFLRERGICADQPVGICLERSLDMVCAILAINKAGGCYVPIDPHYPDVRKKEMLQDAKANIVITPQFFLDNDSEIRRQASENLGIPVLGEQIAYIIFTSGSTGRAKGIAISHQALANHMAWFLETFAVNQSDAILQKTPFSFDASVWEFWAALMTGAKLVMAKPGGHQDTTYLVETIKNNNITLLQVVPTLLEILLNEPGFCECSSLRLLFSGGEALKKRVWDDFQNTLNIPLINLYGPAETTIDVAFHSCRVSENTLTIPVGKPVLNTSLYILDKYLQPVPIGTQGELYVASEQLARGYWQAPFMTAERFLPNPFSSNGSRFYRTGDRARYLQDGTIEFLGRIDHQVKLRGFRIETDEIVTVLEQQPWVVRAVVKAWSRLVAYVELKEAPNNWQDILRSVVRNTLPSYMAPSLFVNVDTWELLPNGKINLNALLEPEAEQTVTNKTYVAPQNEVEKNLTKIWSEVLRLPHIGIEDNFFDLGGDSILCLQVIAKARSLGITFTPQDLFNYPQIIQLAPNVKKSVTTTLPLVPVGSEIPLTPVQQWFFQQSFAKPEHWNQAVLLDLKQNFDVAELKTALVQIAQNHEATKLRFRKTPNGWKQYLSNNDNHVTFDVVELSARQASSLQTIASKFQAQLNLEEGTLFRAVYFQIEGDTPNKLLLIIHHLIVDGVSWRVILQDLAIALQKQLASLSVSNFATWATQLHLLSDTQQEKNNLEKDLDFWTQQISTSELPLDFPENLENNFEDSIAQIECNFSQSETESLLYELPRAHKIRIQEALLTVLLEAVTEWTQQSEIVIALESHGRESNFEVSLDVSNAVGWFTSLFPFKLKRKTDSLLKNLEAVKQQLGNLPSNGISYGLLSCRQELADVLPKIPEGILFNYLGQFDENFGNESAPFVPATEDAGVSRAPENRRPFQLEVTGLIINGKLQMRFVFSKALHQEETIQALAQRFYTAFQSLLQESTTIVIEENNVEDIYPLAPVQEGMLFHANYELESGVYLQQVTGEMTGVLETSAWKQAWERTIDKHPSLRATFIQQDLPRPLQRIHQRVNLPFVYEDWSALDAESINSQWNELLKTDRQQGFCLETPPLMRLTLLKTGEQQWRFLWTHHHLLLDGWSLPLIFRSVINFYYNRPQYEAPSYRDFIAYLNNKPSNSASVANFWRHSLSNLSQATSFGLKHANSDYQTLETTLGHQTYQQLLTVAQKNRVTLNTIVQAAWSILLSRYSTSNDVVFGVTVSGRPPELPGSSEMVGLFINTLPLRVTLDEATPLKQWLQQLRDCTLQINQHSSSRLVDIQGFSDIPRGQSLFESIVVYENYPVDNTLRQEESELSISSVQSLEKTHYPVTLYALPGDDLTLKIAFQKNIGSVEQREKLLDNLTQVLRNFTEDLEFVGEIGLLSQAEALTHNKADTNLIPQVTVDKLFSQQASLTPNALAVLNGSEWLTYEELEQKSLQFAQVLRQKGVTQETLVAVYLERHANLLVTFLGILKAGGAFVGLDPSFPSDRLEFMLADSGAKFIITEEKLASQLPSSQATTVLLSELTSQQAEELPVVSNNHNNHLAYVIYTSGSTGRPKGVQISHSALVNFLLSFRSQPGMSVSDTFVSVTTTSFDISILELFLPLITGARLVVAERETVYDGFKLVQLLQQTQATVMQATPATWRLLLTAGWQPSKSFRVFCGGEAMPIDLAKSLLLAGVELWNVYGPTETTIWSTVKQVKQPEDALSIGQPIANTSIYILDSAGKPVPNGIVGELFIGGAGVARGYLARPNLTAERFVPNPFSKEPGARMYCTGDLARFLPNGEIEFLGRLDYQVKIRGFRIELGEIETVVGNYPEIAQAVIKAIDDTSNTSTDKKLVAYLVAKPNTDKPSPSNLRAYVLEKLPEYMVPSAWVYLDAMPLTPNNKIDRKALAAPTFDSRLGYTAPRNDIEAALVDIWQSIMNIESIGVKDNFFDLGGHSLIAAQIHATIRKVFFVDVSLREMFAALTIEKTAQLITGKETQPGRTEKIAKAFLRMKQMTPEEKAKLLQTKR